jgi:hypothetical protein
MNQEKQTGLKGDVPIVLSKWYDACKWILEKVDAFPKNQRFIFGTRLADRSLGILEKLVEAAYSQGEMKIELLQTANRDLAVLRWLMRMAKDRQIITLKQYEYCCGLMFECGRMLGGWIKDAQQRKRP